VRRKIARIVDQVVALDDERFARRVRMKVRHVDELRWLTETDDAFDANREQVGR
jgi:hypothetical protein